MTAATHPEVLSPPARPLARSAWCVVAAFGTYFCMYAFRKPFTAAAYGDEAFWGVGYKTLLVVAQALGYALSKFLGIKVIAEVRRHRRAGLLLALIGAAEAALLLFGLTPAPVNFVWLFANGVALGLVFGLLIGFLEGRRQTEALAACVCGSFIVGDGFAKTVGATLLNAGVSEQWMPCLSGLLFVPPLVFFVWMLTRIQPPSAEDVAERTERTPMNAAERWAFFGRYATGLTLLVVFFLLVTILRSVRNDFARELWQGLGEPAAPATFTVSEWVVMVGVLALNGLIVLVRDNRRAFLGSLALAVAGLGLVAATVAGQRAGLLSPFAFMVLHGIGLYLPYFAFHTTVFERLIAMTRDRGNVGYLLYVADFVGYLGYAGVLLGLNLLAPGEDFLAFFFGLSWFVVAAGGVLLLACWRYFANHPATRGVGRIDGSTS